VAINTEYARKRRRWLEISQEEMARRIGVHRMTFWRWETGEREPRADELQRWARALDITLDRLLTEPAEVAS